MVEACLVAANAAAQTPLAGIEGVDATKYPVVITPTRLRQSLADVPASVTVIDAETLRRFGVRSVPDALRLVPGMAVTRAMGPDYRVGYHGTNILTPRRMNVLVDGISVYSPAFAEVLWTQLPVAIDDIDRIEVTRGPASAAYGPNSMLAVVNVLTKHPKDVERGFGRLTVGSQSAVDATARAAFSAGSTTVSVTANRTQDSGYDFVSKDDRGHDSTRMNRLAVRSQTDLSDMASLELQAAVVKGKTEVPFIDDFQLTYPDRHVEDIYFGGTLVGQLSPAHELRLRLNHMRQRTRQSWRTCLPTIAVMPEMFDMWRANPAYANTLIAGQIPSGGTPADDALAAAVIQAVQRLGPRFLLPTCVTPNQDLAQSRTAIELQDTHVFSERLRTVAGVGARQQRGESQTFWGGEVSRDLYFLFGNVEARPVDWLTLNAGGYFEHDSMSESTFSPRTAANFRLSPSQTLRFVLSRGTRSPDIQEQRANWSYTFTDISPPLEGSTTARFFQSALGPGNLDSERITSKEIGYLLNMQRYGLLFDLRLFHDKLSKLISERTNLSGFAATNNGAVTLEGAEIQASLQLSPRQYAFVNYAYLGNRDVLGPLEGSHYSRHSGSVGVSRAFGPGWEGSIAYYGASGDGLFESSYGRLDLLASKTGNAGDLRWTTSFALRRLDNPEVMYANGPASVLSSRYADRWQVYAQIMLRIP
jgi:iron complex outermembrane receptor protein